MSLRNTLMDEQLDVVRKAGKMSEGTVDVNKAENVFFSKSKYLFMSSNAFFLEPGDSILEMTKVPPV